VPTSADPAPPPAPQARADLAALATRLRPALWRYARVLGADAATADDLVQEAFVAALARPGFDASAPGAVFTFLRTTCRRTWQRSRRCRLSVRELDEADAVWAARCGDGAGDGYVDALRACVEALPARGRALLATTYGDGDGRAASGARFRLGRDGVKSALRRLRAFLHRCITHRLGREA
jgi:DNA-directed RNA polymerase specialized sigma24 family protein